MMRLYLSVIWIVSAWIPLSAYAESDYEVFLRQKVQVTAFHIHGSRAFSESELLTLVNGSVGRDLSGSELIAHAERVTQFYRQRGYGRAHAILSRQDFANGEVKLLVTTAVMPTVWLEGGQSAPTPQVRTTEKHSGQMEAVQALLERAESWRSKGRDDFALESLDKVLNVAPGLPEALAMRAKIEFHKGRHKEAQATLNELRRKQPDSREIAKIETLLNSRGRDKASLQRARALITEGTLLQRQADRFQEEGKMRDAGEKHNLSVARYNQAVAVFNELYPNGPPAGELTLEYWQMVSLTPGGGELAREGMMKLVQESPGNPLFQLALIEHDLAHLPIKKQTLESLIALTKISSISKQARRVWRNTMMHLDDKPESLVYLKEYLIAEAGDSAVREKYAEIEKAQELERRHLADPGYRARVEGLALFNKGATEEALPVLEQALSTQANQVEVVSALGMLHLRRGEHAQAKKYFLQAAKIKGSDAGKWYSLANVAEFWLLMSEARNARKDKNFALAALKINRALELDRHQVAAVAALGDNQLDQGLFPEAEATYRRALTMDSVHSGALTGLLGLYIQQGKLQEADKMIDSLSVEQRTAMGSELRRFQIELSQAQASRLLANGHESEAIVYLEQARLLRPESPWFYFSLANLYGKNQQVEKGEAIFFELLEGRSDDVEALYAYALFQSNWGKPQSVLDTLARIPDSVRQPKVRQLWVQSRLRLVHELIGLGKTDEAKRLLAETERDAEGDAENLLRIAMVWSELGSSGYAENMFARLRSELPSIGWRLGYAELLDQRQAPELKAELDEIAAMSALGDDDTKRYLALRRSYTLRLAQSQLAKKQYELVHRTVAPLLSPSRQLIPFYLLDAEAYWSENNLPKASATFAIVLHLDAANAEARRGYIETLALAGQQSLALQQLKLWSALSESESFNLRLQYAELYLYLNEIASATKHHLPLARAYPAHPDVVSLGWRIAQKAHRPDEQIVWMQKDMALSKVSKDRSNTVKNVQVEEAIAAFGHVGYDEMNSRKSIERDWKEKKLAELLDRRTPWLLAAFDMRSRSGTAGLSQYNSLEVPVEYRRSWQADDEISLRTETVRVDAGSVVPNSADLGSMLLCRPNCAGSLQQQAQGQNLNMGYHSDHVLADLGVTPLAFPVSNVVGGIKWLGDVGPVGYSLDLSRRPLTGSVLSFAGARDPNTGIVWGGVVATGGTLGVSKDKGEEFGFWANLGMHQLTGTHVISNDRLQLMAGETWRFIHEENRLFSAGVTALHWRHSHNAGEYSLGHGGYYSPQSFLSLSLPLTYGARRPRFSYQFRASVSFSQSQTQTADYYPNDPALQAQAVALQATSYVNPTYTGGEAIGRGYSMRGICEYQVERKLIVGALAAIDRSENYSPNRAMIYLRYSLDRPAAQPVAFPPLPVEPSSQFN